VRRARPRCLEARSPAAGTMRLQPPVRARSPPPQRAARPGADAPRRARQARPRARPCARARSRIPAHCSCSLASCAVCNRSSGSFASSAPTRRSSAGGDIGTSFHQRARRVAHDRADHAGLRHAIERALAGRHLVEQATRDHRSLRASASRPSNCSGAMYWNVPTTAPSAVSGSATVGEGAVAAVPAPGAAPRPVARASRSP